MLDLRRLSHLVALADARHFARAAEQVHLSQPAFSRSIQALERDLGQRLFERETGEVRPTPAGVFLIDKARRLLFDARCLQRDAELYALGDLGDARFGAGPFPAATLLPRVLPELRRRHPQLRLQVEVSAWAYLLEHLRAERIEFFVAEVRSLPPDDRLSIQPIGRQHGGFFVRVGHPLAGQPCTLAQAWSCGVAMTQLPAVLKAALGALLGLPPGQVPAVALECDDLLQLRTVALETDTVVGATHAAMQADVRAGRLTPLRISGLPPLYSAMGVVSLRNLSPSPMARLAIQLFIDVAAQVNAESAAEPAAPSLRERRAVAPRQRGTGRG
jgi:DNA-binding transcriptional LysR family regulator